MDSADVRDTDRNKAWFCLNESVSYTGDEHEKGQMTLREVVLLEEG